MPEKPIADPTLFRFRLPGHPETLSWPDLIGSMLGSILDTVELTDGGQRVKIDGFRLKHPAMGDIVYPVIYPEDQQLRIASRFESETRPYQPLQAVTAAEPRIALLGRMLGLLQSSTALFADGVAVRPDGFAPLLPETYMVPSAGDPAQILSQLGRCCQSECEFCYLKNNPADLAVADGERFISDEELALYIEQFNPAGQVELFHSDWSVREILSDQRAIPAMRQIRGKTGSPFFLVTNGDHITPRSARELAELSPVMMIVSVNVLDPLLRSTHIKGRADIGEALRNLKEAHVPFAASITAWPGALMERLRETLVETSRFDPLFIRVNLPGYTQFTAAPDWDTRSTWRQIVALVRAARPESKAPIFSIPSMFEIESEWEDPLAPRILGVIPGSPGAQAGLREGDLIAEVNGIEVRSRHQLITLLNIISNQATFKVIRDGIETELPLIPADVSSMCGKYCFPHGLIIPWSLPASWIDEIPEIGRLHRARRLLILASPLLERSLNLMIKYSNDPDRRRIQLCYPKAAYFGGNIAVNDMCVVSDFVAALQSENPQPDDLIIISNTGFNEWGRDLSGRHWEALERIFGVQTLLYNCVRCTF